MKGASTWYGKVNEAGDYTVLARITALDGTGTQVLPEEGYCLTQADIDTISCKVFDLGTNKNDPTGVEVTPAPSITAVDNILDTLATNGWPVSEDQAGYNFKHTLGPEYAPEAEHWYLIEYKITLTTTTIIWGRVKVKTVLIQSE